jgi:hypothetical protein
LITPMAVLRERQVALQLISHRTVDGEFSSVRLAPEGERFLLAASTDESYEGEGEGQPRQFLLGEFDGWSRGLSATHALFVGSDHVVLLDREGGGTSLRLEDTRMGNVSWRMTLPDVAAATFDVGADGRWRITEMTHAGFRRIDGRVGQPRRAETRWSVGDTGGHHPVAQLAGDGNIALVVASRWESSALPWSDRWRAQTMLLAAGPTRTTVLATTRQMVDCLSTPVHVNGFVCVAFDGREGRVWRFDPDRGLAPIGRTLGFIWADTYNEPNRVNATVNGRLVQMRLDTASLDVLLTSDDDCGYGGQAVAGEFVATVCAVNGQTTVRLYRMTQSETGDAIPVLSR